MGDAMIGLIEELRSLVGNERGFIHKKLLGIGKTLVKTVIPGASAITEAVGTVRGFLGSGGPAITTARPTVPRTTTARITQTSIGQRQFGSLVKFGSEERFGGLGVHPQDEGPCLPPLKRGPQGLCIAPTSPLGASRLVGEATMGRYGAALIPGSQIVDRATCLRGMQLGNDGLCYNKGQITNKQRMWPAGAKPLLSGGEMNAIRTAATARGRVARAAGRLGIIPKAARKRRTPAGHKAELVHA